ncbi:IS91 family transposase [Zooshikella ganghwensis]|uniref:IS91 family transposase n=1 Tax=Zooshikella ganghwensis TaxID=202772 RepID=UPI00197D691F
MRIPSKLKHLLHTKQLWWRYYLKHKDQIRPVVVDNIIKILSCGLRTLGYATFACHNPHCNHTKIVCFSCKSRFCNTCGYKATQQWIAQQNSVLPQTEWQHITFTLPRELCLILQDNRHLLGDLSRLAAQVILKVAKKKGVTPGIFTALHTFGRDLKWNVHVHLSTTRGGLCADQSTWQSLYFAKHSLMPMWRYEIINLLRNAYETLTLPPTLSTYSWLDQHYQKPWIVHLAKASKNHQKNVNYLGRYIKRPPLALSRLAHYDGHCVIFNYLDHNTKTHRRFECTAEDFMTRLTQHIPEKGFRLIRYYGFLANRVRGKLLPKVYRLLDQPEKNAQPLHWPELLKASFGVDPLVCILCQSRLVLVKRTVGKTINALRRYHYHLALMKPIPA